MATNNFIIFILFGFAVFVWILFGTRKNKKDELLDDSQSIKLTNQEISCKNSKISSENSFPAKGRFLPKIKLVYLNTSDLVHARTIQPFKSRANTDYFEATCYMEQKKRSFRFDRILYGVELSSGEILSQSDVYTLIHPSRKSPEWLETRPIDVEKFHNQSEA